MENVEGKCCEGKTKMNDVGNFDFETRVRLGASLAKHIFPGRWEESSKGNVLRNSGVYIAFVSPDMPESEVSRETINVTYLSSYEGEAVHIYSHYREIFGDCCDVNLIRDNATFVKVEE